MELVGECVRAVGVFETDTEREREREREREM